MLKITNKEIIDILKERGYKVTPQRLMICKVVLTSENHPSVEEVYDLVKREHPAISIAMFTKLFLY